MGSKQYAPTHDVKFFDVINATSIVLNKYIKFYTPEDNETFQEGEMLTCKKETWSGNLFIYKGCLLVD
jgi:ABC-type transporter MlaC component